MSRSYRVRDASICSDLNLNPEDMDMIPVGFEEGKSEVAVL